MARRIAIANQKGGVAKTTTVQTLGVALSEMGESVLLVDLDPQACLTFCVGLDPDTCEPSIHDVILGRVEPKQAILSLETRGSDLDLLPSNIDLAGAEVVLSSKTGREFALARALESVDKQYDWALIDCPPSLGILTICGLTAAQEVLIPIQCETLSYRGVGQLLETIDEVRRFTNPDLVVRGVIATMFDQRTRLGREVLQEVNRLYGLEVVGSPVRKSIRFAEAPALGKSIFEYAPSTPGAQAYREIAAALKGGTFVEGS